MGSGEFQAPKSAIVSAALCFKLEDMLRTSAFAGSTPLHPVLLTRQCGTTSTPRWPRRLASFFSPGARSALITFSLPCSSASNPARLVKPKLIASHLSAFLYQKTWRNSCHSSLRRMLSESPSSRFARSSLTLKDLQVHHGTVHDHRWRM